MSTVSQISNAFQVAAVGWQLLHCALCRYVSACATQVGFTCGLKQQLDQTTGIAVVLLCYHSWAATLLIDMWHTLRLQVGANGWPGGLWRQRLSARLASLRCGGSRLGFPVLPCLQCAGAPYDCRFAHTFAPFFISGCEVVRSDAGVVFAAACG